MQRFAFSCAAAASSAAGSASGAARRGSILKVPPSCGSSDSSSIAAATPGSSDPVVGAHRAFAGAHRVFPGARGLGRPAERRALEHDRPRRKLVVVVDEAERAVRLPEADQLVAGPGGSRSEEQGPEDEAAHC